MKTACLAALVLLATSAAGHTILFTYDSVTTAYSVDANIDPISAQTETTVACGGGCTANSGPFRLAYDGDIGELRVLGDFDGTPSLGSLEVVVDDTDSTGTSTITESLSYTNKDNQLQTAQSLVADCSGNFFATNSSWIWNLVQNDTETRTLLPANDTSDPGTHFVTYNDDTNTLMAIEQTSAGATTLVERSVDDLSVLSTLSLNYADSTLWDGALYSFELGILLFQTNATHTNIYVTYENGSPDVTHYTAVPAPSQPLQGAAYLTAPSCSVSIPCPEDCNREDSHGFCNTVLGECVCFSDWTGEDCGTPAGPASVLSSSLLLTALLGLAALFLAA